MNYTVVICSVTRHWHSFTRVIFHHCVPMSRTSTHTGVTKWEIWVKFLDTRWSGRWRPAPPHLDSWRWKKGHGFGLGHVIKELQITKEDFKKKATLSPMVGWLRLVVLVSPGNLNEGDWHLDICLKKIFETSSWPTSTYLHQVPKSANKPHHLRYFQQKVKLGHGGFGTVWRAIDRKTNHFVAVKEIDKLKAYWQGAKRSEIQMEISILQACDHTNLGDSKRWLGSWLVGRWTKNDMVSWNYQIYL